MRMYLKPGHFAMSLLIYSLTVQALRSTGYIGCFKDTGNRVLKGKEKDFNPNSGDRCKRFCRNHRYRYAGTESGEECFCGHDIRVKTPAHDCDYECEGNSREMCGGDWRISIYDTWHCATKPCENGATCMDIDARNYNCNCTDEWTGKHCEHEISETTIKLQSITTKPTIELNITSTVVTTKQRTTQAESFKGTDIDTETNVTASPYIKFADGPGSSMIAMYIVLPLGVIGILVVIAVVIKRRRKHKKEPVSELSSHETGPVPDMYANLSSQEGGTELEHGNQSHNASGHEAARSGNGVGVSCKEGRVSLEQETEEYNTITLRPNNKSMFHNSYDRVVKPTSSVDKIYSNLSTIQLSNEQILASNTYSHTGRYPEDNHVSSSADNTVNTYNILQPKAHTHITGDRMEEYSLYDRTDSGLADIMEGADNYSHMSTAISLQNYKVENIIIGNENIYLNEEEYATVQKAFKK